MVMEQWLVAADFNGTWFEYPTETEFFKAIAYAVKDDG